MKLLLLALTTALVILAQAEDLENQSYNAMLAKIEAGTADGPVNRFDPYPHPPFPEVDCDALEQIFEANGDQVCPDPATISYSDPELDLRVCAEYRIWYPDHCNMMRDHCKLLAENVNLIGMCHKPQIGPKHKYEKRVPYSACDHGGLSLDSTYCEKVEENEHICGVFMKSYLTTCHFERDWCINLKEKGNVELAKILTPKHNHTYMNDNKFYHKCGMYNPLVGHSNSLLEFENIDRPHMFKMDHVCNNVGAHDYKFQDHESMNSNSYTLRKYDDYQHLETSVHNCTNPDSETENIQSLGPQTN